MRHTDMFNFGLRHVIGCVILCCIIDITRCSDVGNDSLSLHLDESWKTNNISIKEGRNGTVDTENVLNVSERTDKAESRSRRLHGSHSYRTMTVRNSTYHKPNGEVKVIGKSRHVFSNNHRVNSTRILQRGNHGGATGVKKAQKSKQDSSVKAQQHGEDAKLSNSNLQEDGVTLRLARSLTTSTMTEVSTSIPSLETFASSGDGATQEASEVETNPTPTPPAVKNQSEVMFTEEPDTTPIGQTTDTVSQSTTQITDQNTTSPTISTPTTKPSETTLNAAEEVQTIEPTADGFNLTTLSTPIPSEQSNVSNAHLTRKLLEVDNITAKTLMESSNHTDTTAESNNSAQVLTTPVPTKRTTDLSSTTSPNITTSGALTNVATKPVIPTPVSRNKRRAEDWRRLLHITVHSPDDDSDISTAEQTVTTITNLTLPAQYSEQQRHENTRFFSMDLDSDSWDYKSTSLPGQKVAIICAKGALEEKLGDIYPHVEIKRLWPDKTSDNLTSCEFVKTCPGKPIDIKLPNVNFENIKVMSTPDMPVIIINYLTTHYGFLDYNLMYHFENRGCMYLIPIRSSYCWFLRSKNVFSPVSTIIIERKFLTQDSKMLMCAIKKSGHGEIKGTWKYTKQPIRIWFSDGRIMGLRKLLSVQVRQQGKSKVNTYCHSRSHLIPVEQHQLSTSSRVVPRPRIALCNDSVITELPLGQEHGCYSVGKIKVHYQCTPDEHAVQVPNECNITISDNCPANEVCFLISLNGQGHVSSAVVGHSPLVKRCLNKCTFGFKKTSDLDVLFTCPGGKQHRIQTNLVDIQCPMHEMLGKAALYICRATYRPKALYFTLFWITFGYVCFCLVMEVVKISVLITCKLINFFMEKADRTRGYCEHCKLWVNSYQEWWDHKNCCACKCPFCGFNFARSEFPKHAKECTSRAVKIENINAVLAVRRTPRVLIWIAVALTKYFKTVCRLSWATVLVVMCLLIISPVQGLNTGPLPEGIWDEYENEVFNCKESCMKLPDSCVCSGQEQNPKAEFNTMRKLNSIVMSGPTPGQAEKIHTVLKSIDVEAPWGTLHVPESYTPAQSAKHISLTWESSQAVGDKIILSGRSSTVLKLEPKTSTVWTMETRDASEKKTLTVSILDFTQMYSAEFLYATGDRSIKTWSEGSCSGDCPKNCGCNTQTCHIQSWLNVRNWRCNPTWCWRVGTGCSCCASDVTELYTNWLATVWRVEHKKTAVVACVEFDHEQRICESVEAGVEIQLGPVKVGFSDPFGETQILNQRIALFHKIPEVTTHIDLFHNFGVTSATSFCNIQSCTHGTVGDYQIFDPDVFVLDDVTSTNYFKKLNNKTKVWMSWEGVSVSYYCNPGDWTTCVSDGVVERNSEAFANVFKSETNYSTTHFFHSSRVVSQGKTLSLDLKARPISTGGDLTAFITVDGLELFSKEIHLEGLKVSMGSCTGCFACNLGATCSFTLSIRKPERFNLHLISRTAGVVVPDTSFLVESDKFNTYTIKVFSVDKKTDICVEILEGKFCKTCPKENLVSCKNFVLDDPKEVALEHRSTIFAKSTQSCGNSTLSCMLSGAKGFFSGIGSFFSGYFGSILKGIIFTLLPIILIVLAIFYGPKLLFILRFCKKGRALTSMNYEPIKQITNIDDFLKTEASSDEGGNFLKSVLGPKLKPA
ncbi:glycoprotein [Soft tick bunyavirus]|nr:glycoprotein [Soft tick bunyavirus]